MWTGRWSDCVFERPVQRHRPATACLIGVLEGEGIGPEVVGCALRVLSALDPDRSRFCIEKGGPIGRAAERLTGSPLSTEVIDFCRSIFDRGGAVLHGAGGGRFVYDLRKHFDLFCKFSPLEVSGELIHSSHFKAEFLHGIDVLVVRENSSGIYQGQWQEGVSSTGEPWAEHSFSYRYSEVRRILEVAARVARLRRNHVTVVYKESGIPSISRLWRDCMAEVATATGVRYSVLDIDYSAYRLLQHAQELDVVAAPNLFGDLLSDLGGVLVGSRGLTFSGNFNAAGAAVYQTNHGAAHDLAGTDRANPVGQIFSLAMMLRESFALLEEADLIERSVAAVWRDGWRTEDLAEKGSRLCGTRQMTDLIISALVGHAKTLGANPALIIPDVRPEIPWESDSP